MKYGKLKVEKSYFEIGESIQKLPKIGKRRQKRQNSTKISKTQIIANNS